MDKLHANVTEYKTFFSIIIAIYNCEKYIIETLKSVNEQTYKDYEVIIIDDCSTDNTHCIVSDFISNKNRFSVYRNVKNMGVAFSRNYGIDLAKSEYICFLDGDDVWKPDKLAIQYSVLKPHKLDGCFTSYAFINEHSQNVGKPYIARDEVLTYKKMLRQNYIGCSTAVIKSEVIKSQRFLENMAHEDYALWLKLLSNGCKLRGIPDVFVSYRVVKGSRSHNKIKAAINRFRIYRRCEHIPVFKSILLFISYSISGIIKHWRLQKNNKQRGENEN